MLTLRYAGAFVGSVEVPGICICADCESGALQIAGMIRDYFELAGPKEPLLCGFEHTEDDTVTFLLSVPEIGNIVIRGAEPSIAQSVRIGLHKVQSYFVVAGFGEGDQFKTLPFSTFRLIKQDIVIDDKRIFGTSEVSIDLSELFNSPISIYAP